MALKCQTLFQRGIVAGTPRRKRHRITSGGCSIWDYEVSDFSPSHQVCPDEESPNQLYTTVALRLGAVHDLRTRSNGDLSLDDIKGLRQDLGNLLREIGLQMAERHDSKQKLAFMSLSTFPRCLLKTEIQLH